jgi:serine/threonine protein kinase
MASPDPAETQRNGEETAGREDFAGTTPLNVALPDQIGQFNQLGHYRLIRLVGSGGVGNVFEALDLQLDRAVAVKVPRLDLVGSQEFTERFLHEARTAAKLDHPNLTSIIDIGSQGPVAYIVSQWCDRGDLATWLKKHPTQEERPATEQIAAFFVLIARAIDHCHRRGVVHLDLKPSNILLQTRDGAAEGSDSLATLHPKVSDFGLARWIDQQLEQTTTSLFLGTPLYMAPEQAAGRRDQIGAATDIFSLGIVLHEVVAGERPFAGSTAIEVMDRIRSADWRRSQLPRDVPRDLAFIIERCLQREPADRFVSAGELADELERSSRGETIRTKPVSALGEFVRWSRRPQRIPQAGIIAIATHLTVLINLFGHFGLLLAGYQMPFEVDHGLFFREMFPAVALLHVPSLINGFRTVARRPYAVLIGTCLSFAFLAVLVGILASGQPTFSVYTDNPLATYVVHLTLSALALVQVWAYLLAVYATRHGRPHPGDETA